MRPFGHRGHGKAVHNVLQSRLAEKWEQTYCSTLYWLRVRLSFSLHAGKLTLKEKKKICMHVYRTYILLLCSIRAWHACRTRMYDMCDAFVSHLCFQIHAFRFNTRAARVLLVLCTLYTDVIVNRYHGDPQYHFIYTYIICTTTLVRLLAPEQALLTTACHNSAGVDRLIIPCMKKIM